MGRYDCVKHTDFCPVCDSKVTGWQTKDGIGSYGNMISDQEFIYAVKSHGASSGDIYDTCPNCKSNLVKRWDNQVGWFEIEVERSINFTVLDGEVVESANFIKPNGLIRFDTYKNFDKLIFDEYKDFLGLTREKYKNKDEILQNLQNAKGYGYSQTIFLNDKKWYQVSNFFETKGKFSDKDEEIILFLKIDIFYDINGDVIDDQAFVFEPINEEIKIYNKEKK